MVWCGVQLCWSSARRLWLAMMVFRSGAWGCVVSLCVYSLGVVSAKLLTGLYYVSI